MPATVDTYRAQGVVFPLDILTPGEAADMRARLETFEAGQGGPLRRDQMNKMHLVFTWLDGLIRHPAIIEALLPVTGPDILCWSSSFFIKEPRDPAFISWHQDATYWGLSEPDAITTIWVALSPSTRDSGCMKVVPGSHHVQVPHVETYGADNLLSRGQEVAVEVDDAQAVSVELRPGQASMHHVLILHGSAPNLSDDRRIGVALRYLPTRVRQTGTARDCATLVAGKDMFGNFDLEPRPAGDNSPEGRAAHRKSNEQTAQIIFKDAKTAM